MPPTLANGKVCYIEIPAADVERSAAFYEEVFGWRLRQRGDGHTASFFPDAGNLGEVYHARDRRLGREVAIEVRTVSDIPREPSGKYRWVISQVPHDCRLPWEAEAA